MRAAIRRSPPVAKRPQVILEENDRKPEVFTFNWGDNESVSPLVPRLLGEGECPQFKDVLRIYVDHTAKGLHPDAELKKSLTGFPVENKQTPLKRAFKDGILFHRAKNNFRL